MLNNFFDKKLKPWSILWIIQRIIVVIFIDRRKPDIPIFHRKKNYHVVDLNTANELLLSIGVKKMKRRWQPKKREQFSQFIYTPPLVSVIMTVYNAADFLHESVESILSQSLENIELLIIDDASDDHSYSILSKFAKESRVRIFRNEVNKGTYWSKNYLMTQAKGQYVAFQDADDFSNIYRLEKQIYPFLDNRKIVVTTCNYARFSNENTIVENRGRIQRESLISIMIDRKIVINRIGYFDSVQVGADYEYFERLSKVFGKNRIEHIPEPLYYARVHKNSLTNKKGLEINMSAQNDFLSVSRKNYIEDFSKWHIEKNFSELHVPFPLPKRHFETDRLITGGKHENNTISASMATFPKRKEALKLVVQSILPQVDRLYIYLNEYEVIPDFLKKDKIEVVLGKNFLGNVRDNGKFFFSKNIDKGYHFAIDDDIIYPSNYVNTLISKIEYYDRKFIVGVHATILEERVKSFFENREVLHFRNNLSLDHFVDIIGTGTIAYHTETFCVDIKKMKTTGMADIWIAIFANKQNIPLIAISRKQNWLQSVSDNEKLESLYMRYLHDDSEQTRLVNENIIFNNKNIVFTLPNIEI